MAGSMKTARSIALDLLQDVLRRGRALDEALAANALQEKLVDAGMRRPHYPELHSSVEI